MALRNDAATGADMERLCTNSRVFLVRPPEITKVVTFNMPVKARNPTMRGKMNNMVEGERM